MAGGGVGLVFESVLVLFGDGGAGDDFLLSHGDGAGRGAVPGDNADGLFFFRGHKFGAEPLEDVVHEGLGHRNFRVLGEARGLEAHVGELVHQGFEGDAVLQRERNRRREGVHEAGDGGAFLGHDDEDFAGLAVFVEADGDVALVAGDGELVSDRAALVRQLTALPTYSKEPRASGCFVSDREAAVFRGWVRLQPSR